MARVAQLGVVIDASGAKQGAAEVTTALVGVGGAADRATAAFERNSKALGDQAINLDAVKHRWDRDTMSMKEAETQASRLNTALDREVAALNRRAAEMERAERQMAVAQIRGAEMNAVFDASAGKIETAGLQLGRMRMELGTLIGRLTGTSGALDRMGGALGAMAVGNGLIIGVLAGIAALSFAYDKLTESSRKHEEALKKSTSALKAWHDEQANGVTGAALKDLKEQQVELDKLKTKLADLKAQQIAERVTAGAMPAGVSVPTSVFGNQKQLQKEIDATLVAVKDGQDRYNLLAFQDLEDKETAKVRERNILLKGDVAIASDRAAAMEKLRYDLQLMKKLRGEASSGDPTADASNLAKRAAVAQEIESIRAALNPNTAKADKGLAQLRQLTDQIALLKAGADQLASSTAIDDFLAKFTVRLTEAAAGNAKVKDALGGLRLALGEAGQAAHTALDSKYTAGLQQQADAARSLYEATVKNTQGTKELTASQQADAEILKGRALLGKGFTDEMAEQIRATKALEVATKDANTTNAILANVAALKAEHAALSEGESSRTTYAADLKRLRELAEANRITDDASRTARIAAIESEHDEANALTLLIAMRKAMADLGPTANLGNIANANIRFGPSTSDVKAAREFTREIDAMARAASTVADMFGNVGRSIGQAIQQAAALVSALARAQAASEAAAAARGTGNEGTANAASSVAQGALAAGWIGAIVSIYNAVSNNIAEQAARLEELRKAQEAYTQALYNYSIVQRTVLETQLAQNNAQTLGLVQAAAKAAGVTISGSIGDGSAKDLQALIDKYLAVFTGPFAGAFKPFIDSLQDLLVKVKANEAAIKALNDALLATAESDLQVRLLTAQGSTAAASALRAHLAQQKEVDAAENQFGKDSPYVAHLKDVQAAETAAAAAAALLAKVRTSTAFGLDLTARGQSLSGDDRGAVATRAQISYNSQLAAAEDLFKAGTITEDMFKEMARILGGEMTKAIDDFDKAAARALQTMKDDLAVRLLIATGDAVGAANLRREIANKRELEGVTDAALLAQIKYVQGLEAIAAAQVEAQRVADIIAAKNQSITQRMITLYETLNPAKAQELKDAQTAIARAKELADASDDVMRARYRELYALEDQAAALKKMTDSMQALADATKRASDFTSSLSDDFLRATGHSYEADVSQLTTKRDDRLMNARKMGLGQDTIDTINAWFSAAMDNLVKQYLPSPSATAAGGALKAALDPNVQYLTNSVAQSISSQQALGLIDLATSQLVELRKIVANTNGGGAGGIRIDVTVQGGMYSGTPGDVGRGIAEAIVPMIDNALGRRVGVDKRLAGSAVFN